MQKNILETVVGFLVLVLASVFFYDAYKSTQVSYGSEGGYEVKAKFERADGLNVGGSIKIGGIAVGKIIQLNLEPTTYQAVATFKIKNGINIPIDSTAAIVSSGLLGEKYVSILPGAESDYIQNKGSLQFTQSSVNLEGLLGKFMFNSASSSTNPEQKAN